MTALGALMTSCFWLWWFNRVSAKREPLGLMLAAFAAGGVMVPAVSLMQQILMQNLPPLTPEQSLSTLLPTVLLVVCLEELAKFAVVFWIMQTHHEFDEPTDGVLYSTAAAMGFTLGEDLLKLDPWRMLNPPGHALFSLFWGYALGQWLLRPGLGKVIVGLGLSCLAHGLWDAFAIHRLAPASPGWIPLAMFPFTFFLFWMLTARLQQQTLAKPIPLAAGNWPTPAGFEQ